MHLYDKVIPPFELIQYSTALILIIVIHSIPSRAITTNHQYY